MLTAHVVRRADLPDDFDSAERHLDPGVIREVAYRQVFTGEELVIIVRETDEAFEDTLTGFDVLPLFSARPSGVAGTDLYASAIPLLPGKRTASLEFGAQLDGERNQELVDQMRDFDHGEIVFQQNGEVDFVIPVVIGIRPWEDQHRAAPGDGEFNTWVNSHLEDLHGVRFDSAPPPANEQLWDLRAE